MLDCQELIFSQNKNWSEGNKRLFGILGGIHTIILSRMDFIHQRTGQFYNFKAFDWRGTLKVEHSDVECNPHTLVGLFK